MNLSQPTKRSDKSITKLPTRALILQKKTRNIFSNLKFPYLKKQGFNFSRLCIFERMDRFKIQLNGM